MVLQDIYCMSLNSIFWKIWLGHICIAVLKPRRQTYCRSFFFYINNLNHTLLTGNLFFLIQKLAQIDFWPLVCAVYLYSFKGRMSFTCFHSVNRTMWCPKTCLFKNLWSAQLIADKKKTPERVPSISRFTRTLIKSAYLYLKHEWLTTYSAAAHLLNQ